MLAVYALLGLVPHFDTAWAQSARNLGMGGVLLPDNTASLYNPAYAAPDFGEATVLPLPLGIISALPLLDFSDGIEVLGLLEQGTHPGSLMLGLPELPTEVSLSVFEGENGELVAALHFAGGAPLRLDTPTTNYRRSLSLPLNFSLGVMSLSVRPYAVLDAHLSTNEALLDLFDKGSNTGELAASASAEAGLAFDFMLAEDFFPHDPEVGLYLGTRVAPYLGFARTEATGAAEAFANIPTLEQISASYEYDLNYFVSNALGYGINGDLGLALRLGQISTGQLDLGLSLSGVGVGVWQGTSVTAAGSGGLGKPSVQESTSTTPERRTTISPYASLIANSSYRFGLSSGAILMLAGDATYTAGGWLTHLGTEVALALDTNSAVMLRGGVGYEDRLHLGVGLGLETPALTYDLALYAYQAAFTTQASYGVAFSLTF